MQLIQHYHVFSKLKAAAGGLQAAGMLSVANPVVGGVVALLGIVSCFLGKGDRGRGDPALVAIQSALPDIKDLIDKWSAG